jgi:choice-of-anchor B domain-containing protein
MKPILSFCLCIWIFSNASAQNLDSLSKVTYPSQVLSSIWGYTAPDGKEYALVGTNRGTSIVDITDPSNPQKLHFVNGAQGSWREIKTYSHYAYISHDNSTQREGIFIIDLKNVQSNITVKDFRGPDGNIRRAHTLYTDSLGYLYLFGGSLGGCAIFSIKEDPLNPVYVGITSNEYIHDGYVRGDTLWASNVYAGTLSVWDLTDRTAPVKIASFNTPMNFTHNAWLSDDGLSLFTTDEKNGASVASYNVNDVTDAKLLYEWKLKPTELSIPHNVHVLNDYLIISHYTEGVVVCDALDPRKVITAGRYDTSPRFSGGGFFGCWGVYPYFPSGNIIASDMEEGMFILKPNYLRGIRAFGTVVDAVSGLPINRAKVGFVETGDSTFTNFDGQFALGSLDPGFFNLKAEANGYISQEIRRLYVRGSILDFEIALQPVTTNVNNPELSDWVNLYTESSLLQVNLQSDLPAVLQLYNSAGALVKEKIGITPGLNSIDWGALSSGFYVATISTEGRQHSRKLFKN